MRDRIRDPKLPMHTVARVQMLMDGGYIEALSRHGRRQTLLSDLLDAEVEVTGVAGGTFDGKMQQTGVQLYISSLADVKILKRARHQSRGSLPVTPMDKILTGYRVRDLTPESPRSWNHHLLPARHRRCAAKWRQEPVDRNPDDASALRIGDVADATGFPDVHDGFLTLTNGEIRDSHVLAPVPPLQATWKQLASQQPSPFDLVSIEGQVVTEVREASQDEYVLLRRWPTFHRDLRPPDGAGRFRP